MADDLKFRVDVAADVSGQEQVDGLVKSVDALGHEARQAGSDAQAAGAGIDAIGAAAQATEARAGPANRKIAASVQDIGRQIDLLSKAWIALSGGSVLVGTAADVGRVADEFAGLRARMRLVVGEGPALEAALAGVQAIALSTGSALAETGKLFTRIAEAGKALGLSQTDALALTESISQAIALSGESAAASQAAIQQLIQGLQSGVLRGEEFNSVMEQAPRLARALADGLGVTTGQLRELANTGALTSATVISALQGQSAALQREFATLPPTIGRALQDLQTQFSAWVGEVDAASGASSKAAAAIELVGQNLDLIASGLINSGQAWLAWKAYKIFEDFLTLRSAVLASATAKATDTAATVANTAATAANSAAQTANTAARGAAVAGTAELAGGVGKLGAALGLLKGLSFAFLLTNLKDLGDWLAKTAYGFTDLAKRNAAQERESKRLEQVTKALKAETAELANQKRLAADAALGLSVRSRALVADFEEQIQKGDQVADALGKVAKALDLSDLKGIADAGAALDALALRGRISANQVRAAWQQALAGKDLRVFEVEARAAFDGTEQGARRLAAALGASLAEAIRRTGKDLGELAGGINAGAARAINDFDLLLDRLGEVQAKGLDVGETLAASLEQATKAATSEAALRAVIERWEALGKQGLLAGERLERGLQGARARLDELRPGINSVAEAFKVLGLRSQEDLQRTAATARQAFQLILQSGTATPAQMAAAFRRYAEAVLEANGGVVTDALRIEAALRGLEIASDAAGKAVITSMGGGARETERLANAAGRAVEEVRRLRTATEGRPPSLSGTVEGTVDRRGGINAQIQLNPHDPELTVDQLRAMGYSTAQIQNYYANRATPQAQQAAGFINRPVATQAIDHADLARMRGLQGDQVKAFVAVFGERLDEEMADFRRKGLARGIDSTERYLSEYAGAWNRAVQLAVEQAKQTVDRQTAAARRAAREAQAERPAPASVHRVEITLGGKTTAVDTASPNAAKALLEVLTHLNKRTTA